MTPNEKKQIQWKLTNYVAGFPSQKIAANTLPGVSEATLINMQKGNWESISDEMWQRVEIEMDRRTASGPVVETENFQTLTLYFMTAKEEGATFAIVGGAGWGKSFAGKKYSQVNRDKNVFYLECAEYWNKRMFLTNMLMAMGRPSGGMNVGEMMEEIVTEVRRKKQPLFIIDEVDKLSDPVLKFFITLYNELDGHCGFVWTSTSNIKKRLTKGINTNKNGYQELFSRIGQRFIELTPTPAEDVRAVAVAMGITDNEKIAKIINEANGDLRRVRRNYIKEKTIANKRRLSTAA